ncbi:MAG: hypothetical protein L0Y44_00320 [Phycisphaerales bacterium]|nr:hypothetical protein [Phycisphaerales bacterium]MCI0629081.1 hypothetical protein [Phycisphaerales bacterium]MCI0675621.1 hypothetical protein [Phycisphaerales bacterium]
MILRTARWLIGSLSLAAFIAWGASSRCSLSWTLPVASDGSQTHFNIRHGCWRWVWGERGTILSNTQPGWRLDRFLKRDWDWWFEFNVTGPVRIVQIPLWVVAFVGAATCLALLRREWYVPQTPDDR